MDFLDYESEGEEERGEGELQPQKCQNSQSDVAFAVPTALEESRVTSAEIISSIPPAKKRKALDISILPQEIQDALARGYVDSDDEGQQIYAKKDNNGKGVAAQKKDPLLTLLPKPKTINPFLSKEPDPPVTVEKKTLSNTVPFKESIPLKSSRPISSSVNMALLLDPSYLDPSVNTAEVSSSTVSRALSQRSAEEEEEPLTDYGRQLKKKREREVEQQLLAGDTSAIFNQDLPLNLSEVVAEHHTWDAAAYATRQEREAAIMSKYTKEGSVKAMVQPSKLQNRRHQLTSLALKAAETEIALLEATGARRKSKAQTQAKYGW